MASDSKVKIFGHQIDNVNEDLSFRTRLSKDFTCPGIKIQRKTDSKLIKVENNLDYYAILCNDGELRVYKNTPESSSHLLDTIHNVLDFSMNDYHFFCIADGKLKSWNGSQFTVFNQNEVSDLRFKQVSCGIDFSLVLTDDGKIYSIGYGLHGQLGHGDLDDSEEFQLIEDLEPVKITQINTGAWHALALSSDGDVYSWGWNQFGQVGLPSKSLADKRCSSRTKDPDELTNVQLTPFPLDGIEEVSIVSCGSRHSALLTKTGHLYTFGWNGFGQLGRKPSYLSLSDPINSACDNIECVDGTFSDLFCSHWLTKVCFMQS